MNIGENIRNLRMARGMTQIDLANTIEVSQAMLCQIERGTKSVSLPLAQQIAQALACSIYDLMKYNGKEECDGSEEI